MSWLLDPHERSDGRLLSAVTRWLPFLLLVVSWLVGWSVSDVLVQRNWILWSLVPTALLLTMRLCIELAADRITPGSRTVMIGFLVHTGLLLAAVWLNPFSCIYGFFGYLDSERFFTGRQKVVVVLVSALLQAIGQAGGPRSVVSVPVLFALLALVNAGLAAVMMNLSREREKQVTARERAAEALARANEENERLHTQLMDRARAAGVAEERARVSREIHDTVAQGLVGVIRQLEAVSSDVESATAHRIEQAEGTARSCLVEVRRAVHALSPYQLRDAGVVEAIGDLVAEWARTYRIVVGFDADDAPAAFDHGPVLIRVVQESLANVARHAQAQTVNVALTGSEVGETLLIGDDGRGFDVERVPLGNGLTGMRERVEAVGGRLSIMSEPGAGCVITATVPK